MSDPDIDTFRTFITGPQNARAYNAALSLARNRACRERPLCLVGAAGQGKSHLLHAIAAYWAAHRPLGETIIVSARDYAQAVHDHAGYRSTLRRRYQVAGLVLCDDLDRLCDDSLEDGAAAQELSDLITYRQMMGVPIVLTAAQPPHQLHRRLRECLGQSVIQALHAPTRDAAAAFLGTWFQRHNARVPETIVETVATRLRGRGSTADLVRIATELVTAQQSGIILNPEVGRAVVDARLKNRPTPQSELGGQDIVQAVCRYYTLPTCVLLSPSRQRPVTQARQIAMYLLGADAGLSTLRVGHVLGRDHSTVVHGQAHIRQLIDQQDPSIVTAVDAVRADRVRQSLLGGQRQGDIASGSQRMAHVA